MYFCKKDFEYVTEGQVIVCQIERLSIDVKNKEVVGITIGCSFFDLPTTRFKYSCALTIEAPEYISPECSLDLALEEEVKVYVRDASWKTTPYDDLRDKIIDSIESMFPNNKVLITLSGSSLV